VPWVIISSGTIGSGDGPINFFVAPNPNITARSAMITVGSQSIQVNQAGTGCSYALRSSNGAVPSVGANGTVDVVSPGACTWEAVSNDGWLSITAAAGSGTGSANYTAQANPTTLPRVGTLTVANITYTVTQPGAPCTATLSSTSSPSIANSGANGSFTFTASALGCAMPAQSFNSWITATSSLVGTAGNVTFTVAPNPLPSARTGRIVVGDQSFTITQLGAACAYSLAAYSATFRQPGGNGDLLASGSAVGCAPTVGSDPEITLGGLSFLNNIFTQPYTVEPFISAVPWVRTTFINFGGVRFTVKQTSY
jgi:trimeric autotransporter adhesin